MRSILSDKSAARWLAGRTIERAVMSPVADGRGGIVTQPHFVLDDGSVVTFRARETEDAPGIEIQFHKARRRRPRPASKEKTDALLDRARGREARLKPADIATLSERDRAIYLGFTDAFDNRPRRVKYGGNRSYLESYNEGLRVYAQERGRP